jgi:hypothetical protein
LSSPTALKSTSGKVARETAPTSQHQLASRDLVRDWWLRFPAKCYKRITPQPQRIETSIKLNSEAGLEATIGAGFFVLAACAARVEVENAPPSFREDN